VIHFFIDQYTPSIDLKWWFINTIDINYWYYQLLITTIPTIVFINYWSYQLLCIDIILTIPTIVYWYYQLLIWTLLIYQLAIYTGFTQLENGGSFHSYVNVYQRVTIPTIDQYTSVSTVQDSSAPGVFSGPDTIPAPTTAGDPGSTSLGGGSPRRGFLRQVGERSNQ